MPTIVKLLEGLKAENIEFDNIFIDLDAKEIKTEKISNDMFHNEMYLLGLTKKLNIRFLRSTGELINSFYIYRKIKNLLKDSQYDLIYIDRSNLTIGAALTFSRHKVVLRLHGVMKQNDLYCNKINKLRNFIKILSLKAPFKYIICTKDGTPGKEFLDKYSKSSVPRSILLNGVDKNISNTSGKITKKNLSISKDVPVFLFLSRLSKDKGIIEFLDALIMMKSLKEQFSVLIVGDGNLLADVKNKIKNENLTNVIVAGTVPHTEIYDYFNISDVYVSLNRLGNLSNTVLEAVNTEMCIITLKRSNHSLRDYSTFNFFKDDVFYVDEENIKNDLAEIMKKLIKNPNIIEQHTKQMIVHKNKLLTWDERVNKEINILQEVVTND